MACQPVPRAQQPRMPSGRLASPPPLHLAMGGEKKVSGTLITSRKCTPRRAVASHAGKREMERKRLNHHTGSQLAQCQAAVATAVNDKVLHRSAGEVDQRLRRVAAADGIVRPVQLCVRFLVGGLVGCG